MAELHRFQPPLLMTLPCEFDSGFQTYRASAFNRLNQGFASVVVVDNRDFSREIIGQIE